MSKNAQNNSTVNEINKIGNEVNTYLSIADTLNQTIGGDEKKVANVQQKITNTLSTIAGFTAAGAALGGIGAPIGAALGAIVALLTDVIRGKTKHLEFVDAKKISEPACELVSSMLNNAIENQILTLSEIETQAEKNRLGLLTLLEKHIHGRNRWKNSYIAHAQHEITRYSGIQKFVDAYRHGLLASLRAPDISRFQADFNMYFNGYFLVYSDLDDFSNGLFTRISFKLEDLNKQINMYKDNEIVIPNTNQTTPTIKSAIPIIAVVGLLGLLLSKKGA